MIFLRKLTVGLLGFAFLLQIGQGDVRSGVSEAQSVKTSPLAGPSVTPQLIRCRFNWPPDYSGQVNVLYNNIAMEDSVETSKVILEGLFKVSVKKRSDGLAINFKQLQLNGNATPGSDVWTQTLRRTIPSFVVNDRGEVIRLEGTEELRANLLDQLKAQGIAGNRLDEMRQMLSDQGLLANIEWFWTPLVRNWNGLDMELGRVYETKARASVPLIPSAMVDMVTTFEVVKRVACEEHRPDENRCVLLQMRQTPDSRQVAEVLRRTRPRQGLVVNQYHWERSIKLITDPNGLIPYNVEVVYKAEIVTQEPGKRPLPSVSIDALRWVFRYPQN